MLHNFVVFFERLVAHWSQSIRSGPWGRQRPLRDGLHDLSTFKNRITFNSLFVKTSCTFDRNKSLFWTELVVRQLLLWFVCATCSNCARWKKYTRALIVGMRMRHVVPLSWSKQKRREENWANWEVILKRIVWLYLQKLIRKNINKLW